MAYFTDLDRSFSLDFNLPQCRSPYLRIYASSEDDDQQPQSEEQQTPEEANGSNFMNPGKDTRQEVSKIYANFANFANFASMQKQEAEVPQAVEAKKVPSQMEVMETTLGRLEQKVSELCGEWSQMKDILSNYFKGKIHEFELITFEDEVDVEENGGTSWVVTNKEGEDMVSRDITREDEDASSLPSLEPCEDAPKKTFVCHIVKAVVTNLTDFYDMFNRFPNSRVDDVAINEGDRILLFNEEHPLWTGIAVVTSKGGVERTDDFAIGDHVSGTCVYVEQGTKYGGTSWVVTNKWGEDVVCRDKIRFARFSEKSTQFGEPSGSSGSSGSSGLSASSGSSSSGTDFTGRIQLTSVYENSVCHLENGKYVVTITRNDGVSSGAFVVHKSDQSCWGTITQLTKDRNQDSAILYWPPNCPLQISNIPNRGYIVDISPDTTTRTTA